MVISVTPKIASAAGEKIDAVLETLFFRDIQIVLRKLTDGKFKVTSKSWDEATCFARPGARGPDGLWTAAHRPQGQAPGRRRRATGGRARAAGWRNHRIPGLLSRNQTVPLRVTRESVTGNARLRYG